MTRLLALDLGSSSVRAAVCDELAEMIDGALARRKVEPHQDDDGAGELDPADYVNGLIECIDELSDAGQLSGVTQVACASQWHSVLALDASGEPASAALTWLDTRAQPRIRLADPEAFHARTGSYLHSLYWTAKVPYIAAELGDSGRRFVGLPDYVRRVLLGDDATSVSVASGTGMLELTTCDWDEEALELAGVSRDQLPEITTAPGRLAPEWRRRWPDLADAEWQPVIGDGAASNLGSSSAAQDSVAITVGTSMAMRVVHGDGVAPPPWNVWRYRVDEKTLVSGIAFSGGGVLHAAAVGLLGLDEHHEPAGIRPGESGLLVVPLHAGSRPPGTAPAGSGVVAGLSLDTTAEQYLAGTMDGVALEAARSLASLESMFGERLTVVLGGGAVHASEWWCQSFAAALGRPVHVADDPEVGARGASAHALGITLPKPSRVVRPDGGDAERMERALGRYVRLVEALKDLTSAQT
ncbi:FGGY family carbohydrate kinase [Flindersiella endophytica]